MAEKTTVLLAEDHQILREGLRELLSAAPGFEVVGEVADGRGVLPAVQELRPDVLLLDLMLPGRGGLDVMQEVARRCPETRVVVLSMHATEPFVFEAMRNGASAYVVKENGITELVRAIREARAGRRYLSPPLSQSAIDAYARRTSTSDPYEDLTGREREVLRLTAQGLSSAGIASRLGIRPRTAETHRANLMRKLGLHGRADLIRYALKRGLLPQD